MTKLYWLYLLPVFARIMGCIGVLLALFACYIYIQFYNYDRCEYLSNEDNYIMSYLLRGGYIGQ